MDGECRSGGDVKVMHVDGLWCFVNTLKRGVVRTIQVGCGQDCTRGCGQRYICKNVVKAKGGEREGGRERERERVVLICYIRRKKLSWEYKSS